MLPLYVNVSRKLIFTSKTAPNLMNFLEVGKPGRILEAGLVLFCPMRISRENWTFTSKAMLVNFVCSIRFERFEVSIQ